MKEKFLLNQGGSYDHETSGRVSGYNFNIFLKKNASYVPPLGSTPFGILGDGVPRVDASNINIRLTLHRKVNGKDKKHVIYSGNLRAAHCHTNEINSTYEYGRFLDTGEFTDASQQWLCIPLSIRFPGCFHIHSGEKIEISVSSTSAVLLGSTVTLAAGVTPATGSPVYYIASQTGTPFADSSLSYVEVTEIEAASHEQETRTFKIETKVIPANKESIEENLGDNICHISLINFRYSRLNLRSFQFMDELSFVREAEITSEIDGNQRKTPAELAQQRQFMTQQRAVAEDRRHHHVLYFNPNDDMDGVVVSATLNKDNVKENTTYLIWTSFYTDLRLQAVGLQQDENRANQKLIKKGYLGKAQKHGVAHPVVKKWFPQFFKSSK